MTPGPSGTGTFWLQSLAPTGADDAAEAHFRARSADKRCRPSVPRPLIARPQEDMLKDFFMRVWAWRSIPVRADEDRETALHRVCAAAVEGSSRLSLAGLRLTNLPPLDGCQQLVEIDLSHNRLRARPDFPTLHRLRRINLSHNPLDLRTLCHARACAIPRRVVSAVPTFPPLPPCQKAHQVLIEAEHEVALVNWMFVTNFVSGPAERVVSARSDTPSAERLRPDAVTAALEVRETVGADVKPELPVLGLGGADPPWVEVPLDQARTAFFAELAQYCDLIGDRPRWRSMLADRPACVIHHPMAADPAMENAFPFRDPGDPSRVHARYADGTGRVAAWTSVGRVTWRRSMLAHFWALAERDELLQPRRLSRDERSRIQRALAEDVRVELARLIAGDARTPRCHVRRLKRENLPPHEGILGGQLGLFVAEADTPDQRHTATCGRILGLYMGMLLETEEDEAAHLSRYPGGHAYLLDFQRPGGRLVGLAGLGAANAIVFANTSLKPGSPASYDPTRLNATFMAFDAHMTDARGRSMRETVIALIAFDALYGPLQPQREVRVEYGDDYLRHFDADGPGEASIKVKQEPMQG